MYWYVLFVHTGREFRVEQLIKKRLDSEKFRPFVPLHEKIIKISGIVKKEVSPLFPSYVFIESEVPSQEFIEKVSPLIHNSLDIVHLLKYSDSEIAIREAERKKLLSLYNDNYCIESSKAIIEGDKIYITDGPLIGQESIIKRVDRHKRRAWIEIDLMGDTKLINVAIEIVKKSSQEISLAYK
ncbi:antiterminator LoaP [Ruminiclostridium herbifermentans]|uniref:Antiterminator LoaP n=1 Tax=Ruminiclostridium herbifermentans TaxID=2488810 RepID=A0A4U7JI02_9FIRM|nr:antiterminator LoaP [Ruminiclostridium herbifermentans]QNU66244.1 antiterminator LoaP [Ruminiclostridium herbifermentans]